MLDMCIYKLKNVLPSMRFTILGDSVLNHFRFAAVMIPLFTLSSFGTGGSNVNFQVACGLPASSSKRGFSLHRHLS